MSKSKPYIMKAAYDNSIWIIEKHTHPPKDRLIGKPLIDPLTNEYENPLWLQLENIADPETGEMIPTITIDQTLKDSITADKVIKDKDKKDKKDLEILTRDELFIRLIAFDETQVKDLTDIKVFMKDIKDYLLFKYREEIKIKKDKA